MDEQQLLKELRECELSPVGRLLFELVRNQFRIINRLDMIVDQNRKIMADINALNAEIGQVLTDETAGFSSVLQAIAAFLSSQPGGTDFTPQIQQLQQIDSDIQALPGKVQAALAPTTGTGTGTDTGSAAGQASANVARKTV
jgi:hypothetical protein